MYDPTSADQFGLVEVKCPYTHRHVTPTQVCRDKGFCSALVVGVDGKEHLALRRSHLYYSQVQGQMAITGRSWCDFVIFTEKSISVERILFDCDIRQTELLPKRIVFLTIVWLQK